jgi:hypothetical protein
LHPRQQDIVEFLSPSTSCWPRIVVDRSKSCRGQRRIPENEFELGAERVTDHPRRTITVQAGVTAHTFDVPFQLESSSAFDPTNTAAPPVRRMQAATPSCALSIRAEDGDEHDALAIVTQ